MGLFNAELRVLSSGPLHIPGCCRGAKEVGDIVNLRQARKAARRDPEAQQAAVNRLLHGRTKSERKLAAARNAQAQRNLDQARVKTGDE